MFKRLFGLKPKNENSAAIARERLQIIVAHERDRKKDASPDFLEDLQKEILEVVRRYLPIEEQQIQIQMDKEGDYDVLELNITLDPKEESEKDQ